MTKKFLLSFCLAISVIAKGQIDCGFTDTTGMQILAAPICSPWRHDIISSEFVPDSTTPTLYYRLNFVFISHPTNTTNLSLYTQAQITSQVDSTIAYLNQEYMYCGSNLPILTAWNPSPLVQDPKIQFTLNAVYFETDTGAIGQSYTTPYFFNKYPHDAAYTLNVYYFTTSGTVALATASNDHVNMTYWDGESVGLNLLLKNGVLKHELGHALGNLADLYPISPNPNNIDPLYPGTYRYFPDDATKDLTWDAACMIGDSVNMGANNNYMGSNCRDHLSARQIAAFHYLVKNNVTKKYTQFNGTTYTWTPPAAPFYTMEVTNTDTINNIAIKASTITVKSGGNLTINSGIIRLGYQGKIIVEPGGKLTMNCVHITTATAGYNSAGIEVWGTGYPQYLSNNTSTTQGVLIMNYCLINGAGVGVTVGKRSGAGFSTNYPINGGGIVLATNTTFSNNFASVDMAPYYQSNATTFSTCVFSVSEDFINYSNAYFLVRLNKVNQVAFHNCDFALRKPSTSTDTTFCILAMSASMRVKDSYFLASESLGGAMYGIYHAGLGSAYSKIEDSWFYNRNGIYLSNSYMPRIVRNKFIMSAMPALGTTLKPACI